jgi:hypothetical protein
VLSSQPHLYDAPECRFARDMQTLIHDSQINYWDDERPTTLWNSCPGAGPSNCRSFRWTDTRVRGLCYRRRQVTHTCLADTLVQRSSRSKLRKPVTHFVYGDIWTLMGPVLGSEAWVATKKAWRLICANKRAESECPSTCYHPSDAHVTKSAL